MRLAGATDRAARGDEHEAQVRRVALAVVEVLGLQAGAAHAAEALECLGGNGYVEDSGMPRLYRESPLNSIWEGSGNVDALDMLRAMAKQPESIEAFFGEVELAAGADSRLDDAVARVRKELADPTTTWSCAPGGSSSSSRWCCRGRCWCGTPRRAVADAFCGSRLAGDWGLAFGTLPAGIDTAAILERAGAGLPG